MKRGDTKPAICIECGATFPKSHHHQIACAPCRKIREARTNAKHAAKVAEARKAGNYQPTPRSKDDANRSTPRSWKRYMTENPWYLAGLFPGCTVDDAAIKMEGWI